MNSDRPEVDAEIDAASEAVGTAAAGNVRVAGDAVAGAESRHRRTHLLNDTTEFMAEGHGRCRGELPMQEMAVGATDTAGFHAHEKVVRPWRRFVHLTGEQSAHAFQPHGLNRSTLRRCVA